MKFDAVLFDFDGVLADSERLHWQSWLKALEPWGLDLPWDVYAANCIGIVDKKMIDFLATRVRQPADIEELWKQYPVKKALFRDASVAAPPIPPDTIDFVRSLELPLAVVTSSWQSEVEPVLAAAGILDCFRARVFGQDVREHKPSPEPYLRAAEMLGCSQPLVIEDSVPGIASGRAAGFEVLALKAPQDLAAAVRARLQGRAGMDLVIFDLDGTLIDSKQDLVDSVNATRRMMGLGELDPEIVASYVGNGAPVLIRRVLGSEASEAEVERALDFFIRYYGEHMLDSTDFYPGGRDAIEALAEAGVQLAVLTNKPVRISNRIIEGLGVASRFVRIYGGNSFEQKKPHPAGIDRLIEETGATRSRTLMVGDSMVDVLTARNAGVVSCGVLWGFQPETFEQAAPDFTVTSMSELTERVLNGAKLPA